MSLSDRSKIALVMFMIILMICAVPVSADEGSGGERRSAPDAGAPVGESLAEKANKDGKVRVIVKINLQAAGTPGNPANIEEGQRRVEAMLNGMGAETKVKFSTIPYMALEVSPNALQGLQNSPLIESIEEDMLLKTDLASSIGRIDADDAWAAGYTGAGQSVAILDTGIQANHPFFGGRIAGEACFSANLCPNGVTWQIGSGAAALTRCGDTLCAHGTHVAGIAAGQGASFSGVAKNATIIPVQVFTKFTGAENCGGDSECVLSYVSNQIQGLEYVYNIRNSYSIAAVNLSLGGGAYTTTCDGESSAYVTAVQNLRNAGIATIAASGNGYYSNAISFPACLSNVFSVGATNDSDQVQAFSNSAAMLDFLAPGYDVTSSIPGSSYATMNGTSMSTPFVTGAWAVLKSYNPPVGVDQIAAALGNTGVYIADPWNGLYRPRIDLDNALAAMPYPITPNPVVNTTNDIDNGRCTPSHCSLREAIRSSNSTGATDTISFNIPGSAPFTIQPTTPLPAIIHPVVINGATQPGYAGTPIIVLNGTKAPANATGLDITAGSSTVKALVINGFKAGGVRFRDGDGNTLQGSYIGTNPAGTAAVCNSIAGVWIMNDSIDNIIGGTTPSQRNIISGNCGYGIFVAVLGIKEIKGNYIGTNAAGTAAVGNTGDGIRFSGIYNAQVGGTAAGAGNVISGNGGNGILIQAGASNKVEGNFIGVNASGSVKIPNGGDGVRIEQGNDNVIGSGAVGARNIISGNNGNGISILGPGGHQTARNIVRGNYIGLDATGSIALGNALSGISSSGARYNDIGGDTAGYGNVISGNGAHGITIDTYADADEIVNNLIGTDATGTLDIGNGANGIRLVDVSSETVRGNVISGNGQNGVLVDASQFSISISGNYIGTTISGNAPLGNDQNGVYLTGTGSFWGIGGNVISANGEAGVFFASDSLQSIGVGGNFIGVGADGTTAMGNGGPGIVARGANHTIGGQYVNSPNIIANNAGPGIQVVSGYALIQRNSIFNNISLGIDLNSDGVTLNDAGDADTGPSNLQNFPVITAAVTNGASIQISGSLNSLASTSFTIEFFASDTCDASGYGEGQRYLGSTPVTTDGSGNATFSVNVATSEPAGSVITATATRGDRTSEFSQCFTVNTGTVPPPIPALLVPVDNALLTNSIPTFDWTDSAGATQYQLQVDDNADFSSPEINETLVDSTFTPAVALADNQYYWRVRAGDAADNWSGWAAADFVIDTSAPSDLTATPLAQTTIQLDWIDHASAETEFRVERSPNGSTGWTQVGTAALVDGVDGIGTFNDMTLLCGTTYYFRVRAYNAATNRLSMPSNTASATTNPCAIFVDVPTPTKEWMQPWIERFYQAGITSGCGLNEYNELLYCPEREVTRAEMAVFVIRALRYPNLPYNPTDPDDHFADVPVEGKVWMRPWIEEFYDLGITQGCGLDENSSLIFCPERSVTRAEMAVFLLRALQGGSYQPPAASHFFTDVPVEGKVWMEAWIDEFYRRGITGGCGVDENNNLIFCPERAVTRAEMAVFIIRAFASIPNP